VSEFNDLQNLRAFFSSMISLCSLTKGLDDISPLGLDPNVRFAPDADIQIAGPEPAFATPPDLSVMAQ